VLNKVPENTGKHFDVLNKKEKPKRDLDEEQRRAELQIMTVYILKYPKEAREKIQHLIAV